MRTLQFAQFVFCNLCCVFYYELYTYSIVLESSATKTIERTSN